VIASSTIIRAVAGAAVLWLAVSAGAAQEATLKSGVFEPPRAAPDFTLPASTGGEFTLSSQRGKLVALAFGFTNCPDVCPTTLLLLAQMRQQLGALADDVQVVFATVDPQRDTAAALRDFLAFFDETFIGVTGTPEQMAALREAYGIVTSRVDDAAGGYRVHHSSFLYLIDRAGLLRALVPFGNNVADITHDVKILLQEPVAAAGPLQ
jgi:protein SCO1/2